MSTVKITLDRMNSRFYTAEEKINWNTYSKRNLSNLSQTQREKSELKKNEEILSEIQDNFKQPNICVIDIPGQGGLAAHMWRNSKHYSNLKKTINPQTQEAPWTLRRRNKENYTKVRHNQISPTPFFPEGQSKLTVFTQLFFFK